MPVSVSNIQNYDELVGPSAFDDPVLGSAQGVVAVTLGGVTYLYVASWRDSRIAIFTLDEATGEAALLDTVENGADLDTNLAGVHDMTVIKAHGSTWLVAGGGNAGGSGLSVFEVQADGSLVNTDNIDDDGSGTLTGAYGRGATVRTGGETYLYYPSRDGDALNVFRLEADGTLAAIQTVNDTASRELDGLRMVLAVSHAGRDFVLGIGFEDDGLSVFEAGTDGTLTTVQNIPDTADTLLREGTALAAAQFGSTTWIYAGGQLEDGITVFAMNADGTLTLHGTRADTAGLALGGLFELTVTEIGGAQYLLASGFRDDGFSLFRAEADGSLTHLRTRFDAGDEQLETHDGAAIVTLGGKPYIYAMGDDDGGFSVYRINFPVEVRKGGNTVEMSETLAGALSVAPDGSALSFDKLNLYKADETALTVRAEDITLRLGDYDPGQTMEIALAGPATQLTVRTDVRLDLEIAGRNGRDDILDSGGGRDLLLGKDGNDALSGNGGADTLRGSGGADTLDGGGGSDLLAGGKGRDKLVGRGGSDTLDGGGGADSLYGQGQNDTLTGGAGADDMRGGGGSDRLVGGGAGDTLVGNNGGDTLAGNNGADLLQGGKGGDLLVGGKGNDTMAGGGGADTFVFAIGDGNDRVMDFRDDVDGLDFDLAGLGYADGAALIAGVGGFTNGQGHAVLDFGADRVVIENTDVGLLADDIF